MRLDEFLDRLSGVEGHGEQYAARCPAHEDARASLSLTAGTDGRILLKCHAGCTSEAVVRALGLTLADLFPDNGRPGGDEIAATYDYVDEARTVLFQVVRFR